MKVSSLILFVIMLGNQLLMSSCNREDDPPSFFIYEGDISLMTTQTDYDGSGGYIYYDTTYSLSSVSKTLIRDSVSEILYINHTGGTGWEYKLYMDSDSITYVDTSHLGMTGYSVEHLKLRLLNEDSLYVYRDVEEAYMENTKYRLLDVILFLNN